jgi:nitrate/nitrite transporter NarK
VLCRGGLVPAILVHDLVIGLAGFTVTVFFLGMAIASLWTATMDIAPNYAGSSSALMNAAGAVAGIVSPVAFGWILDRTGSWTTPFAFSVGLLLFAIVMTYWIRPDRPIEAIPKVGSLAAAGE